MTDDLYQTLEVDRDAKPKEIKTAFRKRAKETHPDQNGGQDAEFKDVVLAYGILSDPNKRDQYDQTGEADTHTERDVAAERAKAWLGDVFNQFYEKLKEEIIYIDLEGKFLEVQNGEVEKAEKGIIILNDEIQTLQKVQERFAQVKGNIIYHGVLDAKVKVARRKIHEFESVLDMLRIVKVYLELMKFDFMEKPSFDDGVFSWHRRSTTPASFPGGWG